MSCLHCLNTHPAAWLRSAPAPRTCLHARCLAVGLPTLHLDETLLSALSSGEPLETAWTRRCGLRPNVSCPAVGLTPLLA